MPVRQCLRMSLSAAIARVARRYVGAESTHRSELRLQTRDSVRRSRVRSQIRCSSCGINVLGRLGIPGDGSVSFMNNYGLSSLHEIICLIAQCTESPTHPVLISRSRLANYIFSCTKTVSVILDLNMLLTLPISPRTGWFHNGPSPLGGDPVNHCRSIVRLNLPLSPLSARCLTILVGSRSAAQIKKKTRLVRNRGYGPGTCGVPGYVLVLP